MRGRGAAAALGPGAGKRVSELEAARVRDEWRTDERIAELEVDLDDSRELRGRLENKLRAKRAELARLRSEHAGLLRRYATAESERATALERRRQLALETAATSAGSGSAGSPLTPDVYARAGEALRDLSRNAARQQALRTVEEARRRDAAEHTAPDEPQGRHAGPRPVVALPVREHRLVPAVAAAVLPYAKPARAASRAQGGFDFFGTQGEQGALEQGALEQGSLEQGRDIDDVVGDEALLADAEVIDLTAHDETEQLDLSGLRVHSS